LALVATYFEKIQLKQKGKSDAIGFCVSFPVDGCWLFE